MPNTWMKHVQDTRAGVGKGKSFKEVLVLAAQTYKRSPPAVKKTKTRRRKKRRHKRRKAKKRTRKRKRHRTRKRKRRRRRRRRRA